MAMDRGPWSSPEQDLNAADFCAVCLIDENEPGKDKIKANCSLPVRKQPGGAIYVQAMHAAAAALAGARGGVKASGASKAKAARKLTAFYRQAKETPPDSLKQLAGQ